MSAERLWASCQWCSSAPSNKVQRQAEPAAAAAWFAGSRPVGENLGRVLEHARCLAPLSTLGRSTLTGRGHLRRAGESPLKERNGIDHCRSKQRPTNLIRRVVRTRVSALALNVTARSGLAGRSVEIQTVTRLPTH